MAAVRSKKFNEDEVLALVEGVQENHVELLGPLSNRLTAARKDATWRDVTDALTPQEFYSYLAKHH